MNTTSVRRVKIAGGIFVGAVFGKLLAVQFNQFWLIGVLIGGIIGGLSCTSKRSLSEAMWNILFILWLSVAGTVGGVGTVGWIRTFFPSVLGEYIVYDSLYLPKLFVTISMVAVAIITAAIVCYCLYCFRKVGKFTTKFVFKELILVYSDECFLCFIYATVGAFIGCLYDDAVTGGVAGVIFGLISHELVHACWLRSMSRLRACST